MSPPQSPLIAGGKEEDWANPKLMKNISSLSPIICVCDNSAPPSYEESTQTKEATKRFSGDSENGGSPSPNASQLYKQVSKTAERTSNGSELSANEVNEEDVVLRRDLGKQVRRRKLEELFSNSIVSVLGVEIKFTRGDERAEVLGAKEGERGGTGHQRWPHGRADHSRDEGGEDLGKW